MVAWCRGTAEPNAYYTKHVEFSGLSRLHEGIFVGVLEPDLSLGLTSAADSMCLALPQHHIQRGCEEPVRTDGFPTASRGH